MSVSINKVVVLLFLTLNGIYQVRASPTEHLFKIGRSKDANELFYEVNVDKSNHLNKRHPITIFWIKHTKNDKIESLTWIQKKFGYGLDYKSISDTSATFAFVAYDKQLFQLKKSNSGNYKVYTLLNKRVVEIERIYIYIEGGTFWLPDIPKVDLYVRHTASDKIVIETINIKSEK